MKNRNRFVPLIWVTLLLLLSSGAVFAQGQSGDSHGRSYGIGQPKTVQDLPPGQLRKDLEGLPAKARGKALGWLQGFSFPAEDVSSLRVNADGAIYYAEPVVSNTANASTTEPTATSAAMDESQVFQLHSRPGSSNVVFLDFDGHTIEASSGWFWIALEALPFDPSQNDNPATVANFTQDELNRIAEIWHRISEDYASFNIDVTTEEPLEFTPTTARLLFTHDTDANGEAMPHQGKGGVAFINMFGRDNFVSTYSPTFVYYTNLSTDNFGATTLNAEAGSHELGHNLGLSHDGTSGLNYYEGHGNGLVSWAPIMGRPFYANVTQWSQGEYPGANNTQDDLAIIADKIGWVGDDHGNSAAQATPLIVEPNGDILVSSPEFDPDNVLPENKGTINDRADVDWFYIDITDSGSLSITATPAWHSFTRSDNRGANLDIELSLFDNNLQLLAVGEPDDDTMATVALTATTGRYYLQVHGVGNDTNSGYGDYASMGMYFLEGNIPVGPIDETPPSPTSMSWQSAPNATSQSTISMTAIQAIDNSGGAVEYLFSCVAGGTGCADTGWQTSQSHTASGLSPGTYYAYTVKARDAMGNQNNVSSSTGDTTDASAANSAPVASAFYSPEPAIITKGKTVSVTLNGSSSSDSDGTIASWSWRDSNGSLVGNSSTVTVKLAQDTHVFNLTVTDNNGAIDSTSLSISVTKPSDGGDSGGGKPCNPKKKSCG